MNTTIEWAESQLRHTRSKLRVAERQNKPAEELKNIRIKISHWENILCALLNMNGGE